MAGALSRILNFRVQDLFRPGGNLLTLDIGSSSVKLLEVEGQPSRPWIRNYGLVPLPQNAFQNNMVQDVGTVAEVIRSMIEEKGCRARHAITAVPGPAVIIKKMQLPNQPTADLENSVLFEAGNFIPESLDNVDLDFQVTDFLESENQLEVLLVAVKRDIISSFTSTLRAAGVEPVVVDVDYFALENMFELSHEVNPDEIVALVNIGARYTCINILRAGRSTFTGDVPVGGREFNEALVRGLGVSMAESEGIKLGQNEEYTEERVEPVIAPVREFLAEEIHRALSFFWTAATDEAITRVYASGGAAQVPGFLPLLAERLEVPVDLANPFENADFSSSIDRDTLLRNGSSFAIAMGLATRRPGDK